MVKHYYVELDGQQFGPYELEQMKSFGLMPNVLVYSTQTEEWAHAESYPELANYVVPVREEAIDIYNAIYYMKLNNDVYGPLSLSELSFLDISSDSMLSVDDMNTWQSASQIKDLLPTLDSLTERNSVAPEPDHSFDTSVFEDVIEEQEAEILSLKKELENNQRRLSEDVEATFDLPVYDLTKNGAVKYQQIENEIISLVKSNVCIVEDTKAVYQKVFITAEAEKTYYIREYSKFIESIKSTIVVVLERLKGVYSSYENDMLLLDNSAKMTRINCMNKSKHEEKQLIDTINHQIESLKNYSNIDVTIDSLKQTLLNRKREIAAKYESYQLEELGKIASIKSEVHQSFSNLRKNVISIIRTLYEEGRNYFENFFNTLYETSKSDISLWTSLKDKGSMPSSFITVGSKKYEYNILGEDVVIVEYCYVELLNNQNLIIRHSNESKTQAHRIVNSLLGRMLASSSPGKVNVAMIDADEMDGTCDVFKFLNRNIFQILARPDEIRKYLDDKERHIGNIIQNMLLGPIKSLYDYNQIKENKEPYHVIVVEDFPVGVSSESLYLLNKILKNGVRAGVNVILLINEDKINYSEDTRKTYNSCNISILEQNCTVYDLTKAEIDEQIQFDAFTDDQLRKIVQYVNSGVEIRKEEAILFADYMISQSEWWTRRSAKYIEIPFGMSEDRQIQQLKITQESGQNSAVVIGIPGSGKSVFLHALICNAAINYSPDELNMYLIDFSGVEFNTYALHNLPHARVIAPEAEREFGLSILNELAEEGHRRMELCRNNEVSDIVDLKAKNPSLYIPRLLIIIDEFQKIFELDDQIGKTATKRIHTIIQEYRKFGINLILATQRLPSSGILPKDLIANRVVFKSSPNDFSSLITLSSNCKIPQLHTGECIYNSESGAPYDNRKVKGFLITKSDRDKLLNQISVFAKDCQYQSPHRLLVFRGNDQPDFRCRRILNQHQVQMEYPREIGIYLGESISIHETDVCAILRKESTNNLLILGGEPQVAERIAYNATISATTAHTDNTATFVLMNFLRHDNPICEEIHSNFEAMPFKTQFVSKQADVTEVLSAIKDEIDKRRNEEDLLNNIYISIFGFQLGRMFDKGVEARRPDDVSKCGKLLEDILRYGPVVGVYTILQCDNIENLIRIGNVLPAFSYRVALQMNENDSTKVVGSTIANRLYDEDRPSSVFRAYFRDNNRNVNIKFKPYK